MTADVRNHGDSPHTPEMNYESMSEDLISLMKDLQIDRTILLGHSMGGKIAMTLALTQVFLIFNASRLPFIDHFTQTEFLLKTKSFFYFISSIVIKFCDVYLNFIVEIDQKIITRKLCWNISLAPTQAFLIVFFSSVSLLLCCIFEFYYFIIEILLIIRRLSFKFVEILTNWWQTLFLKPQLVETLIVEDIAPTKSRSVVVSGFPTYIAAMQKVVFDHSITSMGNARKTADIQLIPTFPVFCIL